MTCLDKQTILGVPSVILNAKRMELSSPVTKIKIALDFDSNAEFFELFGIHR